MSRRFWRGTLTGGLAAGILDTFLAMGQFGIGPIIVYQSVASGLLGRASYSGGVATAALGMLLHFFIATTAAAAYVGASLKLKPLVQKAVPFGLAFGVAVYFFMREIVLPLSAARRGPFAWVGLVGHAFCVGLPIALAALRAQRMEPLGLLGMRPVDPSRRLDRRVGSGAPGCRPRPAERRGIGPGRIPLSLPGALSGREDGQQEGGTPGRHRLRQRAGGVGHDARAASLPLRLDPRHGMARRPHGLGGPADARRGWKPSRRSRGAPGRDAPRGGLRRSVWRRSNGGMGVRVVSSGRKLRDGAGRNHLVCALPRASGSGEGLRVPDPLPGGGEPLSALRVPGQGDPVSDWPSLQGVAMRVSSTAAQGVVGAGTLIRFQQRGPRVYGRYAGGGVRRGRLVGVLSRDTLVFRYAQVEALGALHAGRSVAEVVRLPTGRLRVIEHFEWTTRDGRGTNVFDEVRA